MNIRNLVVLVCCVAALAVAPAVAEEAVPQHDAGEYMVTIYHVAPGQHLAFLEWQAKNEAVAKEAGVMPSMWFAHMDGDSWDYITIGPVQTPEQDAKVEELRKKKGMKTGFANGLVLRSFVVSHTDTTAWGPTSAAALVEAAGK